MNVSHRGLTNLTSLFAQYMTHDIYISHWNIKGKSKVFYGQEPPSGESTTTECGVNYQQLAVITEIAQWGSPRYSQPQPATDNGVRDGR